MLAARSGVDLDAASRRGCCACSARTAPARPRRSRCCSAAAAGRRQRAAVRAVAAVPARRAAASARCCRPAGVPDTLTVGELIELFRSYYPRPRSVADTRGTGRRRRPARAPLRQALRRPAAPRAVRAGDLRQSGNPVPRTSRPPASMSKRARHCGKRYASWSAQGCAVVLTTHYLGGGRSARRSCQACWRVSRIVASGSVQQIRARVAQRRIRCVIAQLAAEQR